MVLRGTDLAIGEGPAEQIFISPTPLLTGMGFVIRRQTRPRFAFAETRSEVGTPQKTLKKPACVRYQRVCRSPLREPLRSRFYVEGELAFSSSATRAARA